MTTNGGPIALFAALVACGAALVACGEDPASAPDTFDLVDTRSATDGAETKDTAEPPDAAPADTSEPDAPEPDAAAPEPDAAPSDVASPPDADAATGPTACDPPLALTPGDAWTTPLGALTLAPAGGTGAYRFALATDGSGALLNALTGAYLAGAAPGVDHVALTDLACAGAATATVRVVGPVAAAPVAVELPPGGAFTVATAEGSGLFSFAVDPNASGATVDASGRYVAGPTPGDDRLVVHDDGTGRSATVAVAVRADANLRADPPELHVPLGHRYPARALGGSGHVAASILGPGAGLALDADGAWVVTAPGPHDALLTDAFTGQTAPQRVVGVAPLDHAVVRTGTATFALSAAAPGDLDGDGHPDAVVGVGEANLDRFQSGAVYVYAGGPGGLDPDPAQVLSGPGREDGLGRALVVADLDGDGLADLAAGAWRADTPPQTDDGAVFVYPGVPGGFFADAPARVLDGPFSSDQLGYALAACDFNADGAPDLAVGAWLGENRAVSPLRANQGVVHIYLGAPGQLPGPAPSIAVYGLAPIGPGGAWDDVADLRAGSALAVGDFDGDGVCDLATSGATFPNVGSNDGAVLVFRGVPATDTDPGGLDPVPARAFAGDSPGGSRLGLSLAAGDVDGDGVDDLLIGHPYYNTSGTNRRGAARLFLGGPAFAGPAAAFESPDAADWSLYGTSNNEYLGYTVAIGEATGAPPADLLVGAWLGECPGCPTDGGRVDVYAGRAGELPGPTPARVVAGAAPGDRLNGGLTVLGDLDGDGHAEILAVAGLDDTLGPDVPRPWVASATPDLPDAPAAPAAIDALTPLDAPGHPGGWRVGQTLALVPDLDGDGLPELAVGAPNARGERSNGHALLAGVVHVHRGASDGFAPAPLLTLDGFPGHSGSDWFGHHLAGLDDFDGDGVSDLAVVARYEDRATTLSAATYLPLDGCADGSLNNPGAAYVFLGDGAGGLAPTPAFAYFGPEANQTLERVLGADVDGDGLTDLVVASRLFDPPGRANAGGFEVLLGRPRADPARVNVICAPAYSWRGVTANDQAGADLAALGDVDGDGCADVAVGAWLEDGGVTNQGAVRVVFGFGPACASATPRALTLVTGGTEDRAGAALATADVDGDGRLDLLVGGPNHRLEGVTVGAAWLVDGRRLAALAPHAAPLVSGQEPTTRLPLLAPDAVPRLRLRGLVAGEGVGGIVALGPATAAGPGLVAVARPSSELTGVAGVSVVTVHAVTLDPSGAIFAIEPDPRAVLGGETDHPGALREGALAFAPGADGPVLLVGAADSAALALDSGAVFASRLASSVASPIEEAP